MSETDLQKLAKPFPQKYISQVDKGYGNKADFISHSTITQRILANVGAYDLEVVEVIRGYVAAIEPDLNASSKRKREGRSPLNDAVVGVLSRLTLTIDGEKHSIVEAGECGDPHNWDHDGARIKDAMSDAFKRASMRFGVGLQLWTSKDPAGYFLDRALQTSPTMAPPTPDHKPERGVEAPSQPKPAPSHGSIDPNKGMSPKQNREIFALMHTLGVSDADCATLAEDEHFPACRHAYVGALLDEEIESFKQLSELDGATIIEKLREIVAQG